MEAQLAEETVVDVVNTTPQRRYGELQCEELLYGIGRALGVVG